MSEHSIEQEKKSGLAPVSFFDIDRIRELIRPVIANIIFHGPVAGVIHEPLAYQDRETCFHIQFSSQFASFPCADIFGGPVYYDSVTLLQHRVERFVEIISVTDSDAGMK